jgi:hypothetical protein
MTILVGMVMNDLATRSFQLFDMPAFDRRK